MSEMLISRRGSQIAEASLIYPVIILVSIMSVVAMVHFYSCSATAAAMCIDARSIADVKGRSVIRTGDMYNALKKNNDDTVNDGGYYDSVYNNPALVEDRYRIEEKKGLLYGSITASYTARLSMSGMFSISKSDVYSIKRSSVNEAQLMWKKQLIKDILENSVSKGENK